MVGLCRIIRYMGDKSSEMANDFSNKLQEKGLVFAKLYLLLAYPYSDRQVCKPPLGFGSRKAEVSVWELLRIKELIKEKRISQRALARETGINVSSINAMVNGQRNTLTADQEDKLSRALGVRPEELYHRGGT